ncbi:MAG: hypothetical protein GEU73_06300 [Chloroflexi bacterium]|nr:hypothetical protein [Chloroflexota bacterium]
MSPWKKVLVSALTATILLAACAPGPATPGGQGTDDGTSASTGPKRVTAAIQGDPHTLYQKLNPASRVRGIDALEQLVAAGLTTPDPGGGLRPQLAVAVPSLENDQWKLLPDGRMETSWTIRDGVQWHDGTPFTAEDLVFTMTVVRDKDLPVFGDFAYDLIDRVEARDSRTVVVHWAEPFNEADSLFSYRRAVPIPRHLLEQAYSEEKATFTDHPYWSNQFVGNGPFRLDDWELGSHLVFRATDSYVLGRPKIDEIEVRFIEDASTLVSNLLAGSVELTMGRSLAGEQAMQARDQWSDGRMDLSFENWIALYPQFIGASPAIVGDVRFRRALLHAIDRQEQVDVLMGGTSAVANSFMNPNQAEYREIEERSVVRYEYDPRKAAQMLEGLGNTRGPDGILRDATNQPLSLEIRTTAGDDLREKMLFSINDDLQQVGVTVDPVIIPRQRASDQEYRATFPAFELTRNPNDVRGMRSIHSRNTALPENNFRVTGNRTRYVNPDFDGLIDRFFMTIPKQERLPILGQILHHLSDQAVIMGILYNTSPTLLSNRLINVGAGGLGATQAWNAHEWDVL